MKKLYWVFQLKYPSNNILIWKFDTIISFYFYFHIWLLRFKQLTSEDKISTLMIKDQKFIFKFVRFLINRKHYNLEYNLPAGKTLTIVSNSQSNLPALNDYFEIVLLNSKIAWLS